MRVSFKKQMLQHHTKKYVDEIRRITCPLFLLDYFMFRVLTTTEFFGAWSRSFSLPEFVTEVQEAIRPVLNAYTKVSMGSSWLML